MLQPQMTLSMTGKQQCLPWQLNSNNFLDIREYIDAPDGGRVAIDWAPTKENLDKDETPCLVVLHGLTGGSHESYIRCLLEVVSFFWFHMNFTTNILCSSLIHPLIIVLLL